jgi:putative N-acetylmannosamine-6-phosphate epimerase/predicted NBD/HSP70 family sugar kinase
MLSNLLAMLKDCPVIASVQASERSAVDYPETLLQLAQASIDQGVEVIRLQGAENIRFIKGKLAVPVIGLIKKAHPGSEIYITPTKHEVKRLLALECDIIALDASPEPRPDGSSFYDLVGLIQTQGRLAMADCDSEAAVDNAITSHANIVSTTLAGYTSARPMTDGPDFDLIRYAVSKGAFVIAEGRFTQRWQVEAALAIGAKGVVIGGAINDPVKQTRALTPVSRAYDKVGAIDLGGTWIRFGLFDRGELVHVRKIARPNDRQDRIDWIREQVKSCKVDRLGIGTGGTVDPSSGEVWEAKEIIPGHKGSVLNSEAFGVPTVALNDGLATAWGHYCHPSKAGKRVATLALGTGVGAGFVSSGRIFCGSRGEYLRINDLYLPNGKTIEEVLGGAGLTENPTTVQQEEAIKGFQIAVEHLRKSYFPDEVVVCGSVGLSDWLRPSLESTGCVASPYGDEAGLMGAYQLAYYK